MTELLELHDTSRMVIAGIILIGYILIMLFFAFVLRKMISRMVRNSKRNGSYQKTWKRLKTK